MAYNNFENGYPQNKGDFSPLHHSSPATQLISPLASNMYSPYFMHEGDTALLHQLDFQFIASHRDGRVILWQMTKKEKEVENKKEAVEENKDQQDHDDNTEEGNNKTTKKSSTITTTMSPPASETASFQAHQSSISDIRLNPNRNLLLTSSWDKTLKLWNVSKASRSCFENHVERTDDEQDSNSNCKWRDIPLGECLSTAVGHTKDVTSCFLFERGIPPLTTTSSTTEGKEEQEQEQEQEQESTTIITTASSAPQGTSSSDAEQDKVELKFKERLIFGLSASRDGTVRLWYFGRMMQNEDETVSGYNLQMLHSAVCLKVVHCTCDWLTTIHPIWSYRSSKDIIFLSGGFDGAVSKWRVDLKEILETLSTHSLATNDSNNYKRSLQQEQEAVEKLKAKSKMEENDSSNHQQQKEHLITSYVASNNKSAINSILVSPDSSLISVCSKDGSMVILSIDLSRPNVDFEILTNTFYDMPKASHVWSLQSATSNKNQAVAEEFLEPVLQLDHPSLYYWLVALSATKISFFDLETKHRIEVIDCFRDDEDVNNDDRKRISRKSFTCFSYSFDSRYIYCGLSDGSVRIYEMMKAQA